MRLSPVALRALKAHVVAQQQLGHAMASAHQIPAQILTRADQITQTLRLHGRHGDAVKLASDQQPDQPLGVALIGLHAIRRATRDQPRRAHQTVHPRGLQPPGEREAGWPRLIRRAHRTRQRGHELRHLTRTPREPLASKLARIAIDDRRHRRADMHIQRHERLSLRHGRHPHDCGPRRGHSSTANPRISCAGADPHTTPGQGPPLRTTGHRVCAQHFGPTFSSSNATLVRCESTERIARYDGPLDSWGSELTAMRMVSKTMNSGSNPGSPAHS